MLWKKLLAFLLICLAAPAGATDYSDPTWPCVQRKVERLSIGLMWPHPVPEIAPEDPALREEIDRLSKTLAVRRLTLDTLRPKAEAFAGRHDGDPALLGLVFEGVFDSLSKRRSRIISDIGEFSLSQIELSEKIEKSRLEMDSEMARDEPDFDKVDGLEEQLDWDQLIYSDRQKSITYLCETPTLLEKRLYGIARLLQEQVKED